MRNLEQWLQVLLFFLCNVDTSQERIWKLFRLMRHAFKTAKLGVQGTTKKSKFITNHKNYIT